jgi:hypothetical protein
MKNDVDDPAVNKQGVCRNCGPQPSSIAGYYTNSTLQQLRFGNFGDVMKAPG